MGRVGVHIKWRILVCFRKEIILCREKYCDSFGMFLRLGGREGELKCGIAPALQYLAWFG